jgi:hypothetical protein
MVVKFMKKFQKKRGIVCSEINDSQTSIFLRLAGLCPSNKTPTLAMDVTSVPQAMFSIDVNLIQHSDMDFEGAQIKSWNNRKD